MSFFPDVYSRRNREKSSEPDVFTYEIPSPGFRINVCQWMEASFGRQASPGSVDYNPWGDVIYDRGILKLERNYQVDSLLHRYNADAPYYSSFQKADFLVRNCRHLNDILSLIEILLAEAGPSAVACRNVVNFQHSINRMQSAYAEMVEIFREHNIGFDLILNPDGPPSSPYIFIRMTDKLTHTEIVKPALLFLTSSGFEKPNSILLNAFDDYRQGRFTDCVKRCRSAYDKTLEAILDRARIKYEKGDSLLKKTAKLFENDLLDPELEKYLKSLDEIGIFKANLSNLVSQSTNGHSHDDLEADKHYAEFAIHIAASTILFLSKTKREQS